MDSQANCAFHYSAESFNFYCWCLGDHERSDEVGGQIMIVRYTANQIASVDEQADAFGSISMMATDDSDVVSGNFRYLPLPASLSSQFQVTTGRLSL